MRNGSTICRALLAHSMTPTAAFELGSIWHPPKCLRARGHEHPTMPHPPCADQWALARQAERGPAVRETLQTSGDNYDAVWAWKWIFRPSATGAEADAHSAHIDGEVAHAPADVAYVAHRRGIRCRGHPTAGAASENLDEGASDGCPRPPYEDESW